MRTFSALLNTYTTYLFPRQERVQSAKKYSSHYLIHLVLWNVSPVHLSFEIMLINKMCLE